MGKIWRKWLIAWILLVLLGWAGLGEATGSLGPPIATSQAFDLSSSSLYVNTASCPPYLPPYKPPHIPPALADCWPCEEWDKTFGGSEDDEGFSVQQTSDGGYILLGYTESYGAGGYDFWLIKTDTQGNRQWDRTFGGTGNDEGRAVQQTSDGGYILLGYTSPYGTEGGSDVWLIKTDAQGNRQWDRTFGLVGWDRGCSVQQTADGGYILLGYSKSGLKYFWLLVKIDAQGNEQWQNAGDGRGHSVQQTVDGGYILLLGAAFRPAGGEFDICLIKTDAQGNRQWDRTFGLIGWDMGFSVQQTSDGGYILLGYTESYGAGGGDVWLIKTNSQGNKQWDKTFGGSGWDIGKSVQQTSDGGYILLGYTESYGVGGGDVWLIKTDAYGNKEWDRTFGGSETEWGFSVQQTEDGGYILLGCTSSYGVGGLDFWLIKYCPEE